MMLNKKREMNQLKPFSIEYISILVKALYQIFLLLINFLNKMPNLLPPNPQNISTSVQHLPSPSKIQRGRSLVICFIVLFL